MFTLDFLLILFCVFIPYSLFWKQPREFLKSMFSRSWQANLLGLLFFAIVPIIYDLFAPGFRSVNSDDIKGITISSNTIEIQFAAATNRPKVSDDALDKVLQLPSGLGKAYRAEWQNAKILKIYNISKSFNTLAFNKNQIVFKDNRALFNKITILKVSMNRGAIWDIFSLLFRVAYVIIPFLLLTVNKASLGFLRHLLVFLIIWLPLEFDALPGGALHIGEGIDLPVAIMAAVPLMLYLYIIVHPFKKLGFGFRMSIREWSYYFTSLLLLFAIIVPIGLGWNFLVFNENFGPSTNLLVSLIGFLIFVAYPEEILFRAVLINIIEAHKSYKMITLLLISALVFGSAHILNPTLNHAPPNWPYFFLSSVAGWFYGWVYLKSGKLFNSALLHATVNSIWVYAFRG